MSISNNGQLKKKGVASSQVRPNSKSASSMASQSRGNKSTASSPDKDIASKIVFHSGTTNAVQHLLIG
jgi:hypothetical protein